LLGILIFKGLTAPSLYKLLGFKGLKSGSDFLLGGGGQEEEYKHYPDNATGLCFRLKLL
jgi:hypothetical protein